MPAGTQDRQRGDTHEGALSGRGMRCRVCTRCSQQEQHRREEQKWPAQLERYLEEACRQRYRQQGKINLWLLPGTDCLRALIAYPRS